MDEAVERLTSLEPGTLFAGYRIDGMLDRGGMGVVYRATDEDLSRTVALKIIAPEHTQNPDAVRRFKAEARLAASLDTRTSSPSIAAASIAASCTWRCASCPARTCAR